MNPIIADSLEEYCNQYRRPLVLANQKSDFFGTTLSPFGDGDECYYNFIDGGFGMGSGNIFFQRFSNTGVGGLLYHANNVGAGIHWYFNK